MTLVGPLTLSYKLSAGSSPISRQSSLHILLSHRKGLLSFLAILPCASTDCSTPVIGTIPALLCNHDDTTVLQLHNKPPIPLACSPCFRAQPIWRATHACAHSPEKVWKLSLNALLSITSLFTCTNSGWLLPALFCCLWRPGCLHLSAPIAYQPINHFLTWSQIIISLLLHSCFRAQVYWS